MSEQYRLVFSGEVLQGQHPAVVRKRLATVLKLSDERLDVLFSGKPVVVKKAIDESNAARYQAVFEKAGARLRVLPLKPAGETVAEHADRPGQDPAPAEGLQVLPVGADVLNPDERRDVPPAEIDTSHLSMQGAVFTVDATDTSVPAPNVDHITLAELGAQLGNADTQAVVAEIDVHFSIAEVGALLAEAGQAPAPAVDMDRVDFDVAEPGAEMDTRPKPPPPAPPDTSHLKIDD